MLESFDKEFNQIQIRIKCQINTKAHNRCLETETDQIFEYERKSVIPIGFGWIGDSGNVQEEEGT